MERSAPLSRYIPPYRPFGSRSQVCWLPLHSKEPARPGILKSRKSLAGHSKQQPVKTLRFSVDTQPAVPTTHEVKPAADGAESSSEAPSTVPSTTFTSEEEERPPGNSEVSLPSLQTSEQSEAITVATDEQTDVANSSEPALSKSYTSVHSEGSATKSSSAAGHSAPYSITGIEDDPGSKGNDSNARIAPSSNRKKRVMHWFQQGMLHNLRSHFQAGDISSSTTSGSGISPPALRLPPSEGWSYVPQEGEAQDPSYPRYASMAILAGLLLFLVVGSTTTLHRSMYGSDRETTAERENTLAPIAIAEEDAVGGLPRVYNGVGGGKGPMIPVYNRPREDSRKSKRRDGAEEPSSYVSATDLVTTTAEHGEGHNLADVQEITGSWADAQLLASGQNAGKRSEHSPLSLHRIETAKRSGSRSSSLRFGLPTFGPNLGLGEATKRSGTPQREAPAEPTSRQASAGALASKEDSTGVRNEARGKGPATVFADSASSLAVEKNAFPGTKTRYLARAQVGTLTTMSAVSSD